MTTYMSHASVSGTIQVADLSVPYYQTLGWAVTTSPAYPSPKSAFSHVWRRDGWGGFSQVVIGDNSVGGDIMGNTYTVAGSRGRIASSRTDGNHREVALRSGTAWADSEIRSIWYSPSLPPAGATHLGQMGHMHRVAQDVTGKWSGVMIDQNIISTIGTTFLAKWDWTTSGGLGNITPTDHIIATLADNSPQITSRSRVSDGAGGYVDIYSVDNLRGVVAGDTITVSGLGVPFDGARSVIGVAAGATSYGNVGPAIFCTGSAASLVAAAPSSGLATFPNVNGVTAPRRMYPFMVASRVIGDTAQAKKWRPGDAEPSWDDPVQAVTVTLSAYPTVTVQPVGMCGLVSNHIFANRYQEYGDPSFAAL